MKLKDFDFRVWDNHNKKYIDSFPYSIKKYQNENEVFLPFSTDLREYGFNETFKNEIQIPSDRVEVELWTGLYDKNGEKIYEGDIIDINADPFIFKDIVCIDMIMGIELKESNYHLCNVVKNFTYGDYIDEIEVVGNIHENHI
ncbi:hypothetical protein K5688_000378 [Campylobacter lari]|nr:hypothetical protein [Campylobacter lari]